MFRKLCLAAAILAATAFGLTPAHAWTPPVGPNWQHQHTPITAVANDGNGHICTMQVQFGQLWGAAYTKVRVVSAYTNVAACEADGLMGYDEGTGDREVLAIAEDDTWVQVTKNPAYYLYTKMKIDMYWGGQWHLGPYSYVGCYCYP